MSLTARWGDLLRTGKDLQSHVAVASAAAFV